MSYHFYIRLIKIVKNIILKVCLKERLTSKVKESIEKNDIVLKRRHIIYFSEINFTHLPNY